MHYVNNAEHTGALEMCRELVSNALIAPTLHAKRRTQPKLKQGHGRRPRITMRNPGFSGAVSVRRIVEELCWTVGESAVRILPQ
jgi:hypothetical protein